jgi:hypothetical protein
VSHAKEQAFGLKGAEVDNAVVVVFLQHLLGTLALGLYLQVPAQRESRERERERERERKGWEIEGTGSHEIRNKERLVHQVATFVTLTLTRPRPLTPTTTQCTPTTALT